MNRCATTLLIAVVACHGDSAVTCYHTSLDRTNVAASGEHHCGCRRWLRCLNQGMYPFQPTVAVTRPLRKPLPGEGGALYAATGGGHLD